MTFDALELTLDLIRLLRPLVIKLAREDASLTKQLRRAITSVAANLAEGAERKGGDRKHLFAIAAGSIGEVRSLLRVALAFGYIGDDEVATALAYIDRIKAMTYRLKM